MKLDEEGCILRCVQLVKPVLSFGLYAAVSRWMIPPHMSNNLTQVYGPAARCKRFSSIWS